MSNTASVAPIGVFDSGVGGLTVLEALTAKLPREHFVYLGDTARLPYGTKSPETVARYSLQAAQALSGYGVKCLVIACNTASSVGLPAIRGRIENVPVIGVIEPGAQAACAASRSGNIAVIATEGTVRGGAYQQAILRIRPEARVHAEPMFVEGATSPDTLVLGCTHFPMLAGAIRRAVGPKVQIVDSAETTAASVDAQLRKAGLARTEGGAGTVRLLATDGRERFARVGSRFLKRSISPDEVELVDL